MAKLFSRGPWLALVITVLSTVEAAAVTTVTASSATLTLPIIPATQIAGLPSSCQVDVAPLAPKQDVLSCVLTNTINLPKTPFGLVYVNKDHALVALPDGVNSTLGVLDTTAFTPKLIHQVPLPEGYAIDEGGLDVTLSHDGRHAFVAAGPGAAVFDVAKAIVGCAEVALGGLNGTSYSTTTGNEDDSVGVAASIKSGPGLSGTQVTLTPDDEYFNNSLDSPMATSHVGFMDLGSGAVGSVLSPDGSTLYVTSESQILTSTLPGFISVLDVEALKANNTNMALKSSVAAGCGPVRAIISWDGKTLWVTARESDLLLAYDTEKMVSNPSESLLANITVGTAPVGLTFARKETRILTADSNRFNTTGATTGTTVVDVENALAGKGQEANLGRVPTGLFPREFAVSPDEKTILLSDFASSQIQVIDASTLP